MNETVTGLEDYDGYSKSTKESFKDRENKVKEILKDKDFEYLDDNGKETTAREYINSKVEELNKTQDILTCLIS